MSYGVNVRFFIQAKHYSQLQGNMDLSGAAEIKSSSPMLLSMSNCTSKSDTIDTIDTKESYLAAIQDQIDQIIQVAQVRLVDEKTLDYYDFSLIEGRGDTFLLMDKRSKIVGMCGEWYDDSDHIPDDLKDSDGIVLHPETQDQLMEFRLHEFPHLAKGIYREFHYLPDHVIIVGFRSASRGSIFFY